MTLNKNSLRKAVYASVLTVAGTNVANASLDDNLSKLNCGQNEIKAHFSGVFPNENPFARLNLNTAGDSENFSQSVYLKDNGSNPTSDRSMDAILGDKHDISEFSNILSLDFVQCYDKNTNLDSVTAGAGFIYYYQPDGSVIQKGATGVGAIGDKQISPLGEEYYQFTLIPDSLFNAGNMFKYMDDSFNEIITQDGIPVSEDTRYKTNGGGTIQQGIYWVGVADTLERVLPSKSRLFCDNSIDLGDDKVLNEYSTTCYIPEGIEVRKVGRDEILNQKNIGTADSFTLASGNDYVVKDGNLEQIVTAHRLNAYVNTPSTISCSTQGSNVNVPISITSPMGSISKVGSFNSFGDFSEEIDKVYSTSCADKTVIVGGYVDINGNELAVKKEVSIDYQSGSGGGDGTGGSGD